MNGSDLMDALYKAKDIDTGEWVEGNLFVLNGIPYIKNEYETVHIDDETICFIFYFDSQTGRRIWENDIFEFDGLLFVIQYLEANGMFLAVSLINGDAFPLENIYRIINNVTIVGNFYDNPELLGMEAENDS